MARPTLPQNQIDKFIELYLEHKMGPTAISRLFEGVTPGQVSHYLKVRGLLRSLKEAAVFNTHRLKSIDVVEAQNITNQFGMAEACRRIGVTSKVLYARGIVAPDPRGNIHSRYEKNLGYFDCIDTDLKAYIVGILIADGSINSRGDLRIELEKKDHYIVEAIRDEISPSAPIRQSSREKTYLGNTRVLETNTFASKCISWIEPLEKVNIVPNKTYKNLGIPNKIPNFLIPSFIRGVFDGDGSVSRGNTTQVRVQFVGQELLLSQIKDYLELNKIARVSKVSKRPTQCWEMRFSAKRDLINFYNLIYENASLYMKRKRDRFIEYGIAT